MLAIASSGIARKLPSLVAGVLLALLTTGAAIGQVTTTTSTTTYAVPGTTAKAIVRYMQSHPIRGDHGSAFANIRPSYTLTVKTAEKGGVCRASSVAVKIRFSLTLPEATGTKGMSKKVRSAWNSFISFVKRHEEHHQQSYIGCANSFVRAARKETAPSCFAVEAEIRQMFDKSKRDCEARQVAWDRGQKSALRGQAIVRLAGY